ncbi:MAG: six-cysteine ranthipeptide SCIFF [Defluviitaleaceae bacterium]|nr:six-cysteine ranthipeptide SCIFF [Defluviitaleaceae bacterium]
MKHVKTVFEGKAQNEEKHIGCGECQTSCQSACKTSCTVANQICEQEA